MSLKLLSLRYGLLGLAVVSLSSCVAVPVDEGGSPPGYGPAYYGYGDSYPWGYGTNVNVYDHWDNYGGRYYGGRGGGPHGRGGGHGGGGHGGGGGHR